MVRRVDRNEEALIWSRKFFLVMRGKDWDPKLMGRCKRLTMYTKGSGKMRNES